MTTDWEFHYAGGVLNMTSGDFEAVFWVWHAIRPIPYKRNKHFGYGR